MRHGLPEVMIDSGAWNRRKREVFDKLMIDARRHLRRDKDSGVREGRGDPRELNLPASDERYMGPSGKRHPGKVSAQIYSLFAGGLQQSIYANITNSA